MDIATHALASYALARGVFPRRRWPVLVGIVVAGTIADVDLVSSLFGPAAYFATRRTYTHSFLGILIIVGISVVAWRYFPSKNAEPVSAVLGPFTLAALLHLALDLFQSEGVALFAPFRASRFAMDWLPTVDPWILVFLATGIFVPELFRLVSSEIGAKNRTPRGRNGAIVAFALITAYIGARALLHSSSIASLNTRSYHGESPRATGAYPDALSLLNWHGVVETSSLICIVNVPGGFGGNFDPESGECFHKPEPSPQLDMAQKTNVAQKYLSAVPFPRAVVSKSNDGYEVVIRSTRDLAEEETRHRIAARILLDSTPAISSQELVWARDVHLR